MIYITCARTCLSFTAKFLLKTRRSLIPEGLKIESYFLARSHRKVPRDRLLASVVLKKERQKQPVRPLLHFRPLAEGPFIENDR